MMAESLPAVHAQTAERERVACDVRRGEPSTRDTTARRPVFSSLALVVSQNLNLKKRGAVS